MSPNGEEDNMPAAEAPVLLERTDSSDRQSDKPLVFLERTDSNDRHSDKRGSIDSDTLSSASLSLASRRRHISDFEQSDLSPSIFRRASTGTAVSFATSHADGFSSNAEEVLGVLRAVESLPSISADYKAHLRWCIDVVAHNRLYEPIMQRSMSMNDEEEFEGFLEAFTDRRDFARSFAENVKSSMRSHIAGDHQMNKEKSKRKKNRMNFISILNEADQLRVHSLLNNIHTWEFDIFALKDACAGQELSVVTYHLFKNYQFFSQFKLPKATFVHLLQKIQDGYISTNPYHNATHAADVTQAVAYFLMGARLYETAKLTDLETMSLVFAAAIHDFQHPGLNNVFHVRTGRPLAILYNDRAVLENHHVSAVFSMMQHDNCNFLQSLSDEQRQIFRQCVIGAVLSTDMAQHFKEIGLLKSKLQTHEFSTFALSEDRQVVLNLALHAADVSNPTRPLDVYLQWVDKVMEEFFLQGDEEKRLNLPVSMFMDRSNSSIPKCQFGFMDVIVQPLFTVFNQLLPDLTPACESLAKNKAHFQIKLDEEMEKAGVSFRRRVSERISPMSSFRESPISKPLKMGSGSFSGFSGFTSPLKPDTGNASSSSLSTDEVNMS